MRAGSKGLPGKNTRELGGLPLYAYSVRVAQQAGAAAVLLSTDITAVLERDHGRGVVSVQRPAALATDDAPMAEVVLHVLSNEVGLAIDDEAIVVLLQPTSPLRSVEDVHRAVGAIAEGEGSLAMGVTRVDSGVLKYGQVIDGRFAPLSRPEHCFANRQSLPPVYRPNGAVYAFRAGWFRRNGGFESPDIVAIEMNAERSIDVDCIEDLERAADWLAQQREGAA
jgi:CMP-N-acetylneuraminic acid synthetase